MCSGEATSKDYLVMYVGTPLYSYNMILYSTAADCRVKHFSLCQALKIADSTIMLKQTTQDKFLN